jgi:hypothetical protein
MTQNDLQNGRSRQSRTNRFRLVPWVRRNPNKPLFNPTDLHGGRRRFYRARRSLLLRMVDKARLVRRPHDDLDDSNDADESPQVAEEDLPDAPRFRNQFVSQE